MDRRNDSSNGMSGLGMLLTGFVAGVAAVAFLDTGVRRRIKNIFENLKDEGREKLEDIRENGEAMVEKGRKTLARKLDDTARRVSR